MQRRAVKFGSAIQVDWQDSRAFSGWSYDPKALMTPARIQSLGYVVQSNRDSLVITTSIGNGGQTMDNLSIPWAAVKEIELLPGSGRFGPEEPPRRHSV